MSRIFTQEKFGKLLLSLVFISSSSFADNWGDWETWNVNKTDVTLTEIKDLGKLRLNLENENRYNNDKDNLYNYSFQGFLSLPTSIKGLTIVPGYKYEYDTNKNLYSNIYVIGVTYKLEKIFQSEWDYAIRNRLEIADTEKSNDLTYKIRVKNSLSHKLPFNGGDKLPCLFTISDEIFYLTNIDEFNENRALAEIEIPIKKNLSFSVGGGIRNKLTQTKTNEYWTANPMATFGLKFDF